MMNIGTVYNIVVSNGPKYLEEGARTGVNYVRGDCQTSALNWMQDIYILYYIYCTWRGGDSKRTLGVHGHQIGLTALYFCSFTKQETVRNGHCFAEKICFELFYELN